MAGPLQVLSRRTLRGFDPGLRDLLTAAQMALELGGLPQVLVWGRARLALPISVEEQEWLRPVVEKLQRDAEQEQRQKQRDQEREQRKRLRSNHSSCAFVVGCSIDSRPLINARKHASRLRPIN